jgi:hypothetical protein
MAAEVEKNPELSDWEDERFESINDLNHVLMQITKAKLVDRHLPDNQKHTNEHLK